MSDDASKGPDDQARVEDAGGSGGATTLKCGRLEARALAEHWPIPPEVRARTVARLTGIIDDPKSRRRDATAAARVLLAVAATNLSAVGVAIKAAEHETLAERLAVLEGRLAEREDKP